LQFYPKKLFDKNLSKIVVLSVLFYEMLFLPPQWTDFKSEKNAFFFILDMLMESFYVVLCDVSPQEGGFLFLPNFLPFLLLLLAICCIID